jgi:hypothetical protein
MFANNAEALPTRVKLEYQAISHIILLRLGTEVLINDIISGERSEKYV